MAHDRTENVAWFLLLALLALLPLVFLPTTIEVYVVPKAVMLWIMASISGAIVLVGDLRRGRLIVPRGPGMRALAAFCLAAAGATVLSPNPFVSLFGAFMRREGLVSLLAYALIYVLVVRLADSRQRVQQATWALIVPVIPTGLYAGAQSFGFEFVPQLNPTRAAVRAYGALGNPDFLGVYAALMLPILAIAFLHTRGIRRIYVGASVFLDVAALLFSYFRGGWLGAALGLGMLGALLGRSVVRRHIKELLLVAAVVGAAIIAAQALRGVQRTPPVAEFGQRAASIASVGTGTAATRLDIWPRALGLVLRRPLLGFGPESFRGQFMPIRGARIIKLEGGARWDRPHNALLYLATTVGIVGLVAYLLFFGGVLSAVVGSRRAGRAGLEAGLASGAVAAFIGDVFVFWSPTATPLVFAALGLAAACVRLKEPDVTEPIELRVPPAVSVAGVGLVAGVMIGVAWLGQASLRGDYYADLGRMAAERGLWEQSTYHYDRAVATAWWINDYRWRAAHGWERLGFAAADGNKLQTAGRILDEGLRIDPFDEQAYVQLGEIYRYQAALGDANTMARAARSFRRALRLDPFSVGARAGMARVMFLEGRYADAIAWSRSALRYNPRDKDLLYLVGWSYERLGDAQRARSSFEELLKVDPTYAPAREALARLKR